MQLLMCMGLADKVSMLQEPLSVEVLGSFPKMCYSFARMEASQQPQGFYVEGYAILKGLPLPVWHAWYMDPSGHAIDGTKVDASAVRKGLLVPVSTFRDYMKDPKFVHHFETFTEMPFYQACRMLKKKMP